MDIEQAVYQILKTDVGNIAVVAGRIFSGHLPQRIHTYPAQAYGAIGDLRPIRTLEGGVTLVSQKIRVFSAAPKYEDASRADYAAIHALDEYRNENFVLANSSPEETMFIEGIFLSEEAHQHDYVDETQLEQFVSVFDCHYLDPLRVTES